MSEMILSETAVVFECPICGHKEIINTGYGEQPPDECNSCLGLMKGKRLRDATPELLETCRAALINCVGTVKALEIAIAKVEKIA